MHKRAVVSFLNLVGFLIAAVSGLVLYITPNGWAAKRLDWTFLGLDKYEWSDIHIVFSILWVAAALFHLSFNWRVLKAFAYQKAKGGWRLKKELALTAALTALIWAATMYHVPPVSYITDLGDRAKESWVESAQTAPFTPNPSPTEYRGNRLQRNDTEEWPTIKPTNAQGRNHYSSR